MCLIVVVFVLVVGADAVADADAVVFAAFVVVVVDFVLMSLVWVFYVSFWVRQ